MTNKTADTLNKIHDAGDHYTPAPKWMPFRRFFGYQSCVIIGRWIGRVFGFQPFFREYTSDWDFAVAKMKGSFWTCRLIPRSYTLTKSWGEQQQTSAGQNPGNADYQFLLEDMTEKARKSQLLNSQMVNGTSKSHSSSSAFSEGLGRTKKTTVT